MGTNLVMRVDAGNFAPRQNDVMIFSLYSKILAKFIYLPIKDVFITSVYSSSGLKFAIQSLKLNKIGKIDFIVCGINLVNVVRAEILGIYSPRESICKLSAGLATRTKSNLIDKIYELWLPLTLHCFQETCGETQHPTACSGKQTFLHCHI